jgi:hypothetical protein
MFKVSKSAGLEHSNCAGLQIELCLRHSTCMVVIFIHSVQILLIDIWYSNFGIVFGIVLLIVFGIY